MNTSGASSSPDAPSADAAHGASKPDASSSPHAPSGDVARRAERRTWLVATCVALVPFACLVARFWFVCDDAFIAFRYSRHLAEGHGLVFNLGESPPVEGYSSFLWVLWLAPFARIGADVALVACATSAACGALLVACVTRFAQRTYALGGRATLFTALLAATLPPIAMWSTGGLESMPFALCTFALFDRLCADPERPHVVQAALLAVAAALLRADGALWAVLALACAALSLLSRGRIGSAGAHELPAPVPEPVERARTASDGAREIPMQAVATPIRVLAITATALVLACALHVAWRESYYRELLPNTAYVKAGLSAMRLERGLDYVVSFFLAVPVCALAPLAMLWTRGRSLDLRSVQSLAFIGGALAYVLFIGGDFMPMGRFILPAMPFVVLTFASALARIYAGGGRPAWRACTFAAISIALALSASLGWNAAPVALRERFHFRWNAPHAETEIAMWRGMRDRAEQWSELGRALALHTNASDSMVLGNIGAIGYYSELHIYDQFGLTSAEVGHRDAPLVRASPGHDKVVTAEFFFDRHPTFYNAYIAGVGSRPEDDLGAGFFASEIGKRVQIESRPLRTEDGFPPNVELRLLRMTRWN